MMKKYVRFFVPVLAALCLYVGGAMAQEASYTGTVRIEPVRLQQLGEFLHVDLDIIMEDVKVKSARGVDFIPLLVSPSTTVSLPGISLKGRNEYLAYERRLSLMGRREREQAKSPYLVRKNTKKESGVIQYRYTLPYEAWMTDARLDVQRDECGCGEVASMNVEQVFAEVTPERVSLPEPYVVMPHFSYVEPLVEEVKNRDVQAECFLNFEVNKVNFIPEYMDNPKELAKIRAMIDDLKLDANVNVKRLDIIGYASPEGTLETNRRLSEGRAMALRNYLAGLYDFPKNQYHIQFGGENWDGLLAALATVEMDHKAEVLDIITNIPIERGRETKLMQLHGGVPYRFMLKHIFPSLRVAICKVSYDVKSFNLAEAKEEIKKRPRNLSLNELFMVANTYPKGSQEFIEVFKIAVSNYPESGIANINAATAALSHQDMASAEYYLGRVNPDDYSAEYYNAMGVLLLLKGDYEQAERYLDKARELGLDAAGNNLEELTRKKTNMNEIKEKERE